MKTINNFRDHLLSIIDQNHPCNKETETQCRELKIVGTILSKLMVIYTTHEIWKHRKDILKKNYYDKTDRKKTIEKWKEMDAHNKEEGKKLGKRVRSNMITDCGDIVKQHNENFNSRELEIIFN